MHWIALQPPHDGAPPPGFDDLPGGAGRSTVATAGPGAGPPGGPAREGASPPLAHGPQTPAHGPHVLPEGRQGSARGPQPVTEGAQAPARGSQAVMEGVQASARGLQAPANGLPPSGDGGLPPLADGLQALGWWALRFTPRVVLLEAEPPQAVLLEVSASERLFGGRRALLAQLLGAGCPLAPARVARAPTALLALARLQVAPGAGRDLDQLPLHTLAAARLHLATLERLGCRTWGELRALPRGGVARRFGAPLLDALDRACGLKPEAYPWLVLPEVFDVPLELQTQVEAAPVLVFAAWRLLAQLRAWLQARQHGVLAFELRWQMDARRDTATEGAVVIRTAVPTLDMAHLQRLLAENLERVTLPAPVLYLRLRSVETAALPGATASLLPDEQRRGDGLAQLLERLAARLGPQQVLRPVACADHRPERMQAWVAATDAGPMPGAARRSGSRQPVAARPAAFRGVSDALYPTWLLDTPLRLAVRRDRPLYQGPLTLLAGPQRVEAAWWDGPALRDYFLAYSAQAGLLWVYRERLAAARVDDDKPAGQWYLHGVFG